MRVEDEDDGDAAEVEDVVVHCLAEVANYILSWVRAKSHEQRSMIHPLEELQVYQL